MSAQRKSINKKISFILVTAATVALFVLTVFAVGYYTSRAETDIVTAQSDRFVFSVSGSTEGKLLGNITLPGAGTVEITVRNCGNNPDDNGLYDLIVMPDVADNATSVSATVNGIAQTAYKYGSHDENGNAVNGNSAMPKGASVFQKLTCANQSSCSVTIGNNGSTDFNVTVAVVHYTPYNYYVGSIFELKMSADEYFDNSGIGNIAKDGQSTEETVSGSDRVHPFNISESFANVYIVS